MKSKTLLLLFCVLYYLACATHQRAAEISFRLLEPSTRSFEASIILYSKLSPSGLVSDDSVTIFWGDGESSIIQRVNGTDMNPANGIPDGEVIGNDYRKNVYRGVHSYAEIPQNGFYIISHYYYNRIGGINNIINSVNIPVYVEDTLFISNNINAGQNSSPQFLIPPNDYANRGNLYTGNTSAYDADGDSLHFALVTPLRDKGQVVPGYTSLQDYCSQIDSNSSFNIDPNTGQITWTSPCIQGLYSIAVLVKEFRCGVPLSTTLRDMQIVVLMEPNNPPVISNLSDTIVLPGDTISFSVTASDPDSAQSVSLLLYGVPDSVYAPTFVTTPGNPATGSFGWRPALGAGKPNAYIYSIRAADNYGVGSLTASMAAYKSFRVWVADTSQCLLSGFNNLDLDKPSFNVFPNPSTHYVQVSSDNVIQQVAIFDAIGKLLFNAETGAIPQKINIFGYQPGMYFIQAKIGDDFITRKFVKPVN